MKRKLIILFGLLLFILPNYLIAQNQRTLKIDAILQNYFVENGPGIGAIVTKKDEVIYTHQLGLANLEYKQAITQQSKFHAGFLSQQFTAYSILLLEKSRKLSLQDDIKKYFPNLKISKKITIENLLSHTSGLYDYWALRSIAGWEIEDFFDKKIALEYIYNQKETNFLPGEEAYFCTTNYLLLAEIVAKVAQKPFSEFVKESILEPLGMKNTFFTDDFYEVFQNRAYNYYNWGEGWKSGKINNGIPGIVGLVTTTDDFANWLLQLNKHHKFKDLIWSRLSNKTKLPKGKYSEFTMGLRKENWNLLNLLSQNGFYNGYRSYMAYLVDDEIGILIWSNNMGMPVEKIAKEILDKIRLTGVGQYVGPAPKPIKLKTEVLKKYEGKYIDDKKCCTKRVEISNDTLVVYDLYYPDFYKLIPIAENIFKTHDSKSNLTFEFYTNGENKFFKIKRGSHVIETNKAFIQYFYTQNRLKIYEGYYYSPFLKTGYEIFFEDDKLKAKHYRGKIIELRGFTKHNFVSNNGFFSNVEFVVENEEILGFYVNTPEVKKLYFQKK